MDFDKLYLFKVKDIKIRLENEHIPYFSVLDLIGIKEVSLIQTKTFTVQLSYETSIDFVSFTSAVEAWKFYNYITVLVFNAVERQNSLIHSIKLNLRILFDDYRFSRMENLFKMILEKYNLNFNRKLRKVTKITMAEDTINFRGISEFYDVFLTAFYCLPDYIDQFIKLKMFITKFHELYISFVEEILKNAYTEVT